GELVLLLSPFRHSYHLDILLHRLSDRFVAQRRPRGTEGFHLHRCSGHESGTARNIDQLIEVFLRPRTVGVANEPPDLAHVRDDVGLHAAHGNGPMTTVSWPQMFTQLVEANIHQDHSIDSIFTVPWIYAAMRSSALKSELGADQRVVLQSITGGQLIGDVCDDRSVDVLEITVAH